MMAGMITLILTGLLRGVRTQRSLVLENLALRHQLVVLQRTVPRPRLRTADRLFFASRRPWPAASIIATVGERRKLLSGGLFRPR